MSPIKGTVLAFAVANLFAAGASAADKPATKESAPQVECSGVNECAGKSACHGAENACKGKNSCKGKGWLSMTEAECKAKGGKVVPKKM